jgi:hypothetical protein
MFFARAQPVRDKLGERPADAKIKKAEVTNNNVSQGEYPKPRYAEAPNQRWNGYHGNGHREESAY